jgi:hypothetical protein
MITNSHQRPKKAISGLIISAHIQIVSHIWRPRVGADEKHCPGSVRTVTDMELGPGRCLYMANSCENFPKRFGASKTSWELYVKSLI